MRPLLVLLALHLVAIPAMAQLPSVPGYDVTLYATVTDPVRLSFDRGTGALYVGRDNAGSGGANGDPVKLHRIAPGGSPVVEIGTTTVKDPDAIVFDALGTASEGAAGSVIAGGVDVTGNNGQLLAVRPDESVELIDGPSALYDNPADFAVDSTGRILMMDARANGTGQVFVVPGTVSPASLIGAAALPGGTGLFVAVDAQDRIFTSQANGTVALFDSTGAVVDATYATGLGSAPAIAAGPGGAFGTDLYAISGGNSLVRIDAQGMLTVLGTGFGTVQDLEFGPDGALYVSEFDKDRIVRIDAPFSSEWDGASELLPDEVCPAWMLLDSATPEAPVLASGTLTLATSTEAENMGYGHTTPEVAMPELLVIEARMRFVSGSSSVVPRAAGFIGFITAPDVGGALFIGPDEIFLTTTGDVKGDSAVLDTNDTTHTYRIVVDGTADGSTIYVFYDGVLRLTGALRTDASNFGPTEGVFWGEGSILASGTLEWEYVRHNAAICTTTTTTSTTSSTSSSTTSTSSSTSTSTTSSSSTSSSSSTVTPTTSVPTTTLPASGCDGIPDGPTFPSLLCRLQSLLGHVNAEDRLGAFQPKLAKNVRKAIERLEDGRTRCADGNLKKTRKRIQQAGKALKQYAHRLNGAAARKKLDAAIREDFLAGGAALDPDVTALRSGVQCPPAP